MNQTHDISDPAKAPPLNGIVAAVFTPFHVNGEVNFERIPRLTDFLAQNGVMGIFICGSTGDGPSLTMEERKKVAEAFVAAAKGKMRAIIHIGHTSISCARDLGAHAEAIGADAISAISPYYFKPDSVEVLVGFLQQVAASAPSLPFYYYHFPGLVHAVDPAEFLRQGARAISNLRGMKSTDPDLSVINACQDVAEGRFDILVGKDEMLLSGLAAGARGAIGSTYNIAPALYRRVFRAFDSGDIQEAQRWQRTAVRMIRSIVSVGGEAAIKYPMRRLGLDCGQRRLPMKQLTSEEMNEIDRRLDALGFDQWAAG